MATQLSEHTEDDFSARTIQRMMKGLSGETTGVPKKYRYDQRYLKALPNHPDNAVNYSVTEEGRQVIRHSDVPQFLSSRTGSGTGFSDLGFEQANDNGVIRPHKCWWREEIVAKSVGDGSSSRLDWSDRRTVLAERDIGFDVVEKELPNREQSVRGEVVRVKGFRAILFEDTVLVRYSMSPSSDGVFPVLDEWWSARNEVLDWVESTFPVKLRSKPLDVSMPLSTQEWGDVRNSFAEWIAGNEEFQDDSPNSLFEVEDDDGERIFHIDTSPTDDLGNSVAEGEFPHSQLGAEHLTNLKQCVKWMATLGVKPDDLKAAKWIRRNRAEVEQVLEFDIGSELANLQQRTRQNSFEIKENQGRVADAVERVDATREEFGQLEEQLQTVKGEARAVMRVVDDHHKVLRGREEFESRVLSELESISEKVSEGSSGDVVQRKWREVEDDPEFSEPWFQDASDEFRGDFHLRAFRIGEGSVTVLDADTIARLRRE